MSTTDPIDLLLELFKPSECQIRGYHNFVKQPGSFFPKCSDCNVIGSAFGKFES